MAAREYTAEGFRDYLVGWIFSDPRLSTMIDSRVGHAQGAMGGTTAAGKQRTPRPSKSRSKGGRSAAGATS